MTSMCQFHNFYGRATNSRKSIPERSHKGLIVYVSSDVGEKLNVGVSKLNFVDLAGKNQTLSVYIFHFFYLFFVRV